MTDAGYSGTPLAKKLGIKPHSKLALVNAPKGWQVPELPEGVKTFRTARQADVILWFVRDASELTGAYDTAKPLIHPASALWVAWPRKAGGHQSTVNDNLVRETALGYDELVDVKTAAIDNDWSGLKIVWRKDHR